MKIDLGTRQDGHKLQIDLETLMETRLLIQANSGGGKSYLLRRLAEQAFGKLPVIIIDPEGEFASLREKFGFVLVGEGGETPADPRSASLVAETLLNIQASAVCDLHEAFRKNPKGRQLWVKNFTEAFIDAPKSQWRDTLIIYDEAQIWCPQDGESECHDAMVSLNTVGRKRGFCPVWATQRLALIDKDASSQLLNRIVGMTFEDVDVGRALKLLSVSSDESKEFSRQIRTLDPGDFFAFGRAIAKERVLFHGGEIQTTHPKRGGKRSAGPPPAPEAVKALLPKLSDLPKQAEDKARTEADLRREIIDLKKQIRSSTATGTITPPASKEMLDAAIERGRAEIRKQWQAERQAKAKALQQYERAAKAVVDAAAKLHLSLQVEDGRTGELPAVPESPVRYVATPTPARVAPPSRQPQAAESNGNLTGPEQRILDAIAEQHAIGIETPKQTAVAFLAGYVVDGGGFCNPRGALRTKGLVEYAGEGIRLTEEGKKAAKWPEYSLDAEDLQRRVLARLPGPEQKILKVLLKHYPNVVTNEDCAEESGYEASGGGYCNPRGRLRSLGLISYENGGVKAEPLLFLE